MAVLVEPAPAKVNLTLAVLGRRADGYHLLDSLVVFAGIADRLTLSPGTGSVARGARRDRRTGRAARRQPGAEGRARARGRRCRASSSAASRSTSACRSRRGLAAARRTRRRHSGFSPGPTGCKPGSLPLQKIAPMIGADVPVCVDPRPRRMRGIGEALSAPLKMPKLAAVMINPGVAVPTKDVFMRLGLKPGGPVRRAAPSRALPRGVEAFVEYLVRHGNDLEAPAVEMEPVIARVLDSLRGTKDCLLARMSGSGATCFGILRVAARGQRRGAQPRGRRAEMVGEGDDVRIVSACARCRIPPPLPAPASSPTPGTAPARRGRSRRSAARA